MGRARLGVIARPPSALSALARRFNRSVRLASSGEEPFEKAFDFPKWTSRPLGSGSRPSEATTFDLQFSALLHGRVPRVDPSLGDGDKIHEVFVDVVTALVSKGLIRAVCSGRRWTFFLAFARF